MASTSASRLKGTSTARSGSVASVRDGKEGVVKVEEGAEGAKGPSAERAGKFFRGAEVAYKQAKMKEDGSQWIQCSIIGIIEVGNKKRYVPPHSRGSFVLSPVHLRNSWRSLYGY